MSKDSYYYSRGQVWKCVGFGKKNVGHEQKNDRPVLIISTPEFYAETKLLLVAPFTTKYKHSHYVLDVSTPSDYVNYLLLEQMTTIDPNCSDYKMTFLYSLSSAAMERVDASLKYLLGFSAEATSYPKAPPRKVKKGTAPVVSTTLDKSETERAPSQVPGASQVRPKREFTLPAEDADVWKEDGTLPNPTSNPKAVTTAPAKPTPKKSTRRSWSLEKAQEFLDDCTSKPREEVISKWAIPNTKAYYSMKNYCEDIVTRPS